MERRSSALIFLLVCCFGCAGHPSGAGATPDGALGRDAASEAAPEAAAEGRTLADGGGDAGREAAGVLCGAAPKHPSVLHLHNAGTTALGLNGGCNYATPIVLHTPSGDLAFAVGGIGACLDSCDAELAGTAQYRGCTDCGVGDIFVIAPGATVDLAWDGRGYVAQTLDACLQASDAGLASNKCALGVTLVPTKTQAATLTFCPGGFSLTGSCPSSVRTIDFTFDTTVAETTADVM
jgi:hypothetical protein